MFCAYHLTHSFFFFPITDLPVSSTAPCKSKHPEPILEPYIGGISIDDVELSAAELEELGKNIEEPGEVVDLYHLRLPPHKVKENAEKVRPDAKKVKSNANTVQASAINVQASASSIESTPSKSDRNGDAIPSPRRSPRGHALPAKNEGDVFIILKFCITDLVGVDPRLDIPKIMIMAHGDTSRGQSITELRECLEDKSDERLKLQFDLCKSFDYFHLFHPAHVCVFSVLLQGNLLTNVSLFSQGPAHPVAGSWSSFYTTLLPKIHWRKSVMLPWRASRCCRASIQSSGTTWRHWWVPNTPR